MEASSHGDTSEVDGIEGWTRATGRATCMGARRAGAAIRPVHKLGTCKDGRPPCKRRHLQARKPEAAMDIDLEIRHLPSLIVAFRDMHQTLHPDIRQWRLSCLKKSDR